MKKNIKGVVITILATTVGAIIGNYVIKDLFSNKITVDEELKKTAQEINKSLPMVLDSETRFDTTMSINDTFIYRYTLINYSLEELNVDTFKENMLPTLKNGYCTSEEMKQFLNKNVSVNYMYYGKDGRQLVVFKLSPSDCKS